MSNSRNQSRRNFIQQTAMAGSAIMLASPLQPLSQTDVSKNISKNIQSKGYAARDASGKLSFWEFERRPVGDNDILIEIKYASICHSDIHQIKGDCGAPGYGTLLNRVVLVLLCKYPKSKTV